MGVLLRVLLRRPWTVDARTGDYCMVWRVGGWRASGEHVERVAEGLAAGVPPLGWQLA